MKFMDEIKWIQRLYALSKSFSLNLSCSFMASHLIPLISLSRPHGVHTWALILLILCNGFSLNPPWSLFHGFSILGHRFDLMILPWIKVINHIWIPWFMLLSLTFRKHKSNDNLKKYKMVINKNKMEEEK